MSTFFLRLAWSALLVLSVACTPVSFFFSEHLSDRFGSVWVTVQSVVLINDEGDPLVIFNESEGLVVNINDEDAIAELFSLRSIPDDTYTDLQITLANTVTITDNDGVQEEFQLAGDHLPGRFEIPCLQIVNEDEATAIAIEFDLNELVLSEENLNLDLKPGMACRNSDEVKSLAKNNARWKGEVVEVIDADSFVLAAQWLQLDSDITVILGEAGVVFDEESDQSSEDTSLLAEGDRVRIFGGFDFATLSLDALSVSIKPAREEDDEDDTEGDEDEGVDDEETGEAQDPGDIEDEDKLGNRGFTEVEGVVVSFDGAVLVITVTDADFVPPAGDLSIAGVSDAHFQRGSLEILAVGQEVELRGSWDGSAYTVKFVNIEGARPGQSMADKALLKVSGVLTDVTGTLLTMTVDSTGDEDAAPTGLTVEIADAFMARGRADCIIPGASITVWGSMDDTGLAEFIATQVKVQGACDKSMGGKPADDEDDEDEGDDGDDKGDDDDVDPIPVDPTEPVET